MRNIRILMAVLLLLSVAFSPACSKRKGEIGTKENPIALYFMPSKTEAIANQYSAVIKAELEKATGFSIKAVSAPDYLTIIRAFGNGQADLAFINTLGYLMAKDWADAEAYLVTLHVGGSPTYRGEIIARSSGSVKSIEDLNDKTFVFSDPFSSAGYLYALKLLNDNKVKPAKVLFAKGHKDAAEMVYSGKADAAAVYYEPPTEGEPRDARVELLPDHPDATLKLKIVALTDEIPSGPIAFRKGLPSLVKSQLVGALIELTRSKSGQIALKGLYDVTGLSLAKDSDYDGVREVIKKLGKTNAELVPGGVTFYNENISPMLAN